MEAVAKKADPTPAAPSSTPANGFKGSRSTLMRVLENEKGKWKRRTWAASLLVLVLSLFIVREHRVSSGMHQLLEKFGDLHDSLSKDGADAGRMNLTFHAQPSWGGHIHKAYRPGRQARKKGLKPKYNVVLVPGFVTSGLEAWEVDGEGCHDAVEFRQRVWGGIGMPKVASTHLACWMKMMKLDPMTGLDPEGYRLRAMQGFDALNYFVPGYVVWARIIQQLSELGYGTDDMHAASYDWRLPLHFMEQRDAWFTRTKHHIELHKGVNGRKAMLIGHSWGGNVVLNFLYWAEKQQPGWVEEHIGLFLNIAGPLLGVPKSLTALLSGQMKDTMQMGVILRRLADALVSPEERAALFRSWGSAIQMLPIGGDRVWGNITWAPDDTRKLREANLTYGTMLDTLVVTSTTGRWAAAANDDLALYVQKALRMHDSDLLQGVPPEKEPMTADNAISALQKTGGELFGRRISALLGLGPQRAQQEKVAEYELDQLSETAKQLLPMANPLETPLPNAPSLKIACLHGVGLPTERAYSYLYVDNRAVPADGSSAAGGEAGGGVEDGAPTPPQGMWRINPESHDQAVGQEFGMLFSDGDATVPLISAGYMCSHPWRGKKLNPAGIDVKIRQYKHTPATRASLGPSPGSGDHVDVMQNTELVTDVVALAAGEWHDVSERVLTDLHNMVAKTWREESD